MKKLWTCLKTDYGMSNELSNFIPVTSMAEYGSVEVQLLSALDGANGLLDVPAAVSPTPVGGEPLVYVE